MIKEELFKHNSSSASFRTDIIVKMLQGKKMTWSKGGFISGILSARLRV
jgi:hypothetical protein